MSSASRSGVGPDSLDAAMMASEIARRYGGEVLYGLSVPTGTGTATRLTAVWSAPLDGNSGTGAMAVSDIRVSCALPVGHSYNPWAYAYRLLWELDAAIREALDDDLEWI